MMLLQYMHFQALLALPWLAVASPAPINPGFKGKRSYTHQDGVKRTLFQHEATGAAIYFVTNSGICETTPGVKQYSGYLNVGGKFDLAEAPPRNLKEETASDAKVSNDVGDEMMWFWFFEARNNPDTAPLAMWLNGGPGCSSMVGLFQARNPLRTSRDFGLTDCSQENGPCHFVNGSSTPSLNPYSFNEYANMLYVDQPLGTGFSHGTGKDNTTSTIKAAPYVWKLMQAFFTQFPGYQNRDFGLFTESYGGHYGPGGLLHAMSASRRRG